MTDLALAVDVSVAGAVCDCLSWYSGNFVGYLIDIRLSTRLTEPDETVDGVFLVPRSCFIT